MNQGRLAQRQSTALTTEPRRARDQDHFETYLVNAYFVGAGDIRRYPRDNDLMDAIWTQQANHAGEYANTQVRTWRACAPGASRSRLLSGLSPGGYRQERDAPRMTDAFAMSLRAIWGRSWRRSNLRLRR
jgi:hypothetical protein